MTQREVTRNPLRVFEPIPAPVSQCQQVYPHPDLPPAADYPANAIIQDPEGRWYRKIPASYGVRSRWEILTRWQAWLPATRVRFFVFVGVYGR